MASAWQLVADIGGTNARFGVVCDGSLVAVRRYPVAAYPAFADALDRFLAEVAALGGWRPRPVAACLAVAGPVDYDELHFTNSPWVIQRRALGDQLGLSHVDLINDFAAVGHAVAGLVDSDWHQLGGTTAVAGKPIAVLGPGTGLGVCALVPVGGDYLVVEGEGGHVDFAPLDNDERAVLDILAERYQRVSVERLLSGPGLVNIYQALARLRGQPAPLDAPAAISAVARDGGDALAAATLEMFCRVLGAVAGNLALTLGARGGVYIAGGIAPGILDMLAASGFRQRFEAKGRFRAFLQPIPTRVVSRDNLGLVGAMAFLRRGKSE